MYVCVYLIINYETVDWCYLCFVDTSWRSIWGWLSFLSVQCKIVVENVMALGGNSLRVFVYFRFEFWNLSGKNEEKHSSPWSGFEVLLFRFKSVFTELHWGLLGHSCLLGAAISNDRWRKQKWHISYWTGQDGHKILASWIFYKFTWKEREKIPGKKKWRKEERNVENKDGMKEARKVRKC